ncbi:MAG: MarR family transcriptional regulator [Polyangiaceae bacterium]
MKSTRKKAALGQCDGGGAVPRDLPKLEVLQADAKRFGVGDPSDVLVLLTLLGTAREVGRFKEMHFARYGLSDGRFFILMQLRRIRESNENAGASSPADLAERSGVSRATITGLLDGLEKDGLISRVPRSDDRRKIDIRITEHGTRLLERTLPDHFTRLGVVMNVLSKSEKEMLTRLLTKVRESVGVQRDD